MSGRTAVRIRRVELDSGDLAGTSGGLPVTSPLRTCYDLASRLGLVEAVVVVDMALHSCPVTLDRLRFYTAGRAGRSGVAQARCVLDQAEPKAESPMESRLRMLLILAGLPRPQAQVPLHDEAGTFFGRPDLFYPGRNLAIEYDGGTHRDSLTVDNRRQNRLHRAGIRLLRYTAPDFYERPRAIVAEVRAALENPPIAGNAGYRGEP